ncbi:MAG TPA: hypothetical protein VF380_07400 [Solirubrobacteraceae bacterium]
MAAKDKGKGGEAAWTAQGDRYIQHLLDDEELRTKLLGAYTSARSAYGRLSNGKGHTHGLFEDPELQQQLLAAATALREATSTLKEPAPKKKAKAPKKRRRGRRGLLLLLAGAGLAIVLSEDLRSKVLDMLFGSEEEFDYSSTTAPATPAPAAVAGD